MGFFEKIRSGLAKTRRSMAVSLNNMLAGFTGENDDFYDELEETLILADTGVECAESIVEELRERVSENGLRGADELRAALTEILTE